jgi:hypothetical protein
LEGVGKEPVVGQAVWDGDLLVLAFIFIALPWLPAREGVCGVAGRIWLADYRQAGCWVGVVV